MILYCVLCRTSQNQPFIELVTDNKAVADHICETNQDKGIFSVVVEKNLNRFPEKRKKEDLRR